MLLAEALVFMFMLIWMIW